jgi:hypothetical protein
MRHAASDLITLVLIYQNKLTARSALTYEQDLNWRSMVYAHLFIRAFFKEAIGVKR